MNQQKARYMVGYAALLASTGIGLYLMYRLGMPVNMDLNFAHLYKAPWVTFASILVFTGVFGPIGLQPGTSSINTSLLPFVTVSLPNQGGQFTSTDQTGYNSAVTSNPNGALIFVKSGNYTTTSEWLMTGNNIITVFAGNATIQFPSTLVLNSLNTANGVAVWSSMFACVSSNNCSVYNLNCVNFNLTNTNISGLVFANNTNLEIFSPKITDATRWARSFTGFLGTKSGQVFDGGNDTVKIYNAWSIGCGSNGIPDGGGCKYFNGSSSSTNKNIVEYWPTDKNFGFTSWDSNPQNGLNGQYHINIERYGGSGTADNQAKILQPPSSGGVVAPRPGSWNWSVVALANADIVLTRTGTGGGTTTLQSGAVAGTTYTGNFQVSAAMFNSKQLFTISNVASFAQNNLGSNYISNNCFAIFVEAAFAATTKSAKFFGGNYDMSGGMGSGPGLNNTGLVVGVSNTNVQVYGTEFINAQIGWSIISLALPATVEQGGDLTLKGVRSLRCTTGAAVSITGGTLGTAYTTADIDGCIADDQGAQIMMTGLVLGIGGQKPGINMKFKNCDFSKVAVGGTVLGGTAGFAQCLGTTFTNCPGITDQGTIVNPFTTVSSAEIRPIGGNLGVNAPAATVAFQSWNKNCSITMGSGLTQASITHANGTVLWYSSSTEGTSFTPTAGVYYVVRDVNQTWNVSGDSSVNMFAIGPDGTVYANGPSSVSGLILPRNTQVTLGAFTGSPTVTVNGIANPFAPITNVTVIDTTNALMLPYGASITFGVVNNPNLSVYINGVSIASPWYRYRVIAFTGGNGALPPAGIMHEVYGTPVMVTFAGATGVSLTAPDGTTVFSGVTALNGYRIDIGYRLQWTAPTIGTFSAWILNE